MVSLVVSFESVLFNLLKKAILGVLGNVTVVVANHLDEESLGLTVAGLGQDLLVDDVNNLLAVLRELLLNFILVTSESICELGILGVLLNRCNCANRGSLL